MGSADAALLKGPEPEAVEPGMYIREYRVQGTENLPRIEIEEAVYPFLGPGRSVEDIEGARAALEKAYFDKGFQTVSVQIPPQDGRGGIVVLKVVEAKVGRVRVEGATYFDLKAIKKKVPSLAEGKVPNFNDVAKEFVALNQHPDRKVTPELKPGAEEGTVDIDLKVEDKLPLHGSVELNNRYSANTTPLRLNAALSYSNLWQLGHTIGGSFQIAPQRVDDALVYSAYYIARVPGVDWLSVMASGTRQNSDVSTLGGTAVAGNGEIYGGRFLFALPAGEKFFHSASFGMDYKHFEQDLSVDGDPIESPVTYYPFTLTYDASWVEKNFVTELNATIVFNLRGMGTVPEEFDNRRYNSDGGFVYFRSELAHTQELPFGFQAYGRGQGQVSSEPLIDTEQFAAGGLDTVRGYLEAAVLGDNAAIGSFELRSPSVDGFLGVNEFRVYGFVEGGVLTIWDPLPEQQNYFTLASIGAGGRLRILEHLNGSFDVGVPLVTQGENTAGSVLMTFEVWADF